MTHITTAQQVLDTEIQGLAALQASLGEAFARACDTLMACKGRIIVSGMGKSGHVGRKIAATLASTGSPASFVHPAEASHGDLGMITAQDVVLALSNSGETPELADMIAYTRRFRIPLIGMVGRAPSALADAADVALVLPSVSEASPVNAPTTSTTMMMALGDALAVCLIEARGFTREDFATFHPGGKLGKALLRVSELMHTGEELPLVAAGTRMADALIVMTTKRFGCAGVVNASGALVGVVTDGDLRRHMGEDLLARAVDEVMTKTPKTIAPHLLAAEALALMNERSITTLFVVENTIPQGIVHIHDLLRSGVA